MHAKATEAFGRYRRELHRYLLRRLRQPQDVDDLASQVYERLCRISDERVVEKPLAYLYGIASHVLADHRVEQEMECHCDHIDCDDDWSDKPCCVLPDDKEERLNLQQQIDRAMAQLPPTHAAVLLAHKRDGLSYDEVAEKLNISVFTVEKYVTQAKARVRTMSWEC